MLCYGDCHTAEQLKIKHQQYGKDEAIVSVLGTDSISPPFQDVLQYLAPSWEGRPLLQCHGQQVCRLRSVWIIPSAHSGCRVLPSSDSCELEATGACWKIRGSSHSLQQPRCKLPQKESAFPRVRSSLAQRKTSTAWHFSSWHSPVGKERGSSARPLQFLQKPPCCCDCLKLPLCNVPASPVRRSTGQALARADALLAEAEHGQHSSAALRCSRPGPENTQDLRSEGLRSKGLN